MTETISTSSAARFSLDALADLFTRAFEAYFYPGATTPQTLAQRVRVEGIDLWRSVALLVGDEPAGIALLALRGERAWCAGFGVTMPFRGRGLASRLAAAMVAQAREAGARTLELEVLTRNTPAIRTYERAGFQRRRDLLILEWRRPAGAQLAAPGEVAPAEPSELLAHFAALHPAPAAWQRDLPALLVGEPAQGIALRSGATLLGFALFREGADGRLRLVDIAAREEAHAAALLRALQSRSGSILTVNEPADSPLIPAFLAAGFAEIDRQHELVLELK